MGLEGKLVFLLALSILSVHVYSQLAYDYFWFVQQWPPGVCATQSCVKPIPQVFTIHGLWPQNNSFPSPSNCPGPVYDATRINGTLRTNMNTYWPDVIRGQNNNFWSHEWTAHGTCSYGTFNQTAYFNTSVQKIMQNDLKNALAVAGIKPGGNWTLVKIKSAIKAKTSKVPVIRCDTTTRSKLLEIVACYNKAGAAMIDCTTPDRCNANVQW